ncbi:SelT/SelW/SelH family protein [Candidatus Poribacteria bacterium]|nr:SelT/SelW/SelH family protein [Candidatus Poribacteria bacterium]MBT5532913.1 SelT/SelW/SelH family protein [Candidatus Poribacteria bacterium]MBT5710421.1 SelT/SelW/SelH family protein [Candidatus Poribacteria bacterium]MBT7804680.1 SelT/SelW/SelH family protein [Candidatus Poribacteria bacterium]
MADALKKAVDGVDDVSLTKSAGGVFEVTVDGTLVFSKKAEGRFPEEQEAIDLVTQAA